MRLQGTLVSLEPLTHGHVDGLSAAAAADRARYRWSPVPEGAAAAQRYIETALAWQQAGTAVPFAIVASSTGRVIGSTRFWNLERWPWPDHHPDSQKEGPDACEIGYTWLTSDAAGTGANTDAKLLMLTRAFESWHVLRVCFHADVRNMRSRAALEGIGARPEGVLRAHRLAVDLTPRDSVRFSIVAAEWPAVKTHLVARLRRKMSDHGLQS